MNIYEKVQLVKKELSERELKKIWRKISLQDLNIMN